MDVSGDFWFAVSRTNAVLEAILNILGDGMLDRAVNNVNQWLVDAGRLLRWP